MTAVHHVAWAMSTLALAHASLRVASQMVESGLERVLAAAVIAVSAAVAEALLLGKLALGASPVALVAVTAAGWLAAIRLLPARGPNPAAEVGGWWARLHTGWRFVAAALAGAFLAWLAWQLRYPSIGLDASLYHYPEVAGWIRNGHPGSILALSYDVPYGNYPLTDEVAQTWGAAIARSWIPLALWNPSMLLLLAAASWRTMRELDVRPALASLATATLLSTPLIVRQVSEPQTDLPMMAWLACCAALALCARRQPGLLVPALVAGGLAVGTKTTAAPMVVAALAVGTYLARGRLHPIRAWLAVGVVVAFGVGGVWYVRNFLQHGWPLWPFSEGLWGDPRPHFFTLNETPFLDRPVATLEGRLDDYSARLGGAWIVLMGSLVLTVAAVAAVRLERGLRRRLLVTGLLAIVAFLIWSLSWGSGLQTSRELVIRHGWALSALRYLLPGIGVATLCVAAASRLPRFAGSAAVGLLWLALGWSLVADARRGQPYIPQASTFAVGIAAGVAILAAGLAVYRLALQRGWQLRMASAPIAVAIAAVVGLLAALPADGYVRRYVNVQQSTAPGRQLVAWFLRQPGFDRDGTISFASRLVLGPLAGHDFAHAVKVVPAYADCRDVRRLATREPVVVSSPDLYRGFFGVAPYTSYRCLERRRPAYDREGLRVYGPADWFLSGHRVRANR